jgi:hypothetical protein
LPGKDTEWRQALWAGAQVYLERDGIAVADLNLRNMKPRALNP